MLHRRPRIRAACWFPLLCLGLPLALATTSRAQLIFDATHFVDRVTAPATIVELGLGGSFETGDVERADGRATAALAMRRGPWLPAVVASGSLRRVDGRWIDRQHLEHVRLRRDWGEAWSTELFVQHAFSEPARVGARWLAGAGPRWAGQWRDGQGLLAVAALPMFEHFRILDDAVADAGEVAREWRVSAYLKGAWQPAGRDWELEGITYVQPRVDDPADLRVVGSVSLQMALFEPLALRLGGSLRYDASPPLETRQLSALASIGLELRWQRWRSEPMPVP